MKIAYKLLLVNCISFITITLIVVFQAAITSAVCCGNTCYSEGICKNDQIQVGCQSASGQLYSNGDVLGKCLICECNLNDCKWRPDNNLCKTTTNLDTCDYSIEPILASAPINSECIDKDDKQKYCENSGCSKFTLLIAGETTVYPNETWGYNFNDTKNIECCGDDKNEYVIYPISNTLNFSNLSNPICCNNELDCVYNNTCYSTDNIYPLASVESMVPEKLLCQNSVWKDCDTDLETCQSCQLNFTGICCGDDKNEHYNFQTCFPNGSCTTNVSDTACCNLSTDCVNNHKCYSTGTDWDINFDGKVEFCENSIWQYNNLSEQNCSNLKFKRTDPENCYDSIDNDCNGGFDFAETLPQMISTGDFREGEYDSACTIKISGRVTDGLNPLGLDQAEIRIEGTFKEFYQNQKPNFIYQDFIDDSGKFDIEVNGDSKYVLTINPTINNDFEQKELIINADFSNKNLGDLPVDNKHSVCNSDCTIIGSTICNKECDSQYGITPHPACFFGIAARVNKSELQVKRAMQLCHERRKGHVISLGDESISCCEGSFEEGPKVQAIMQSDCDLITTRKIVTYNGRPIVMVIHNADCNP